jgi:hypothetical protein
MADSLIPQPLITMSHADATALAKRLSSRGTATPSLAEMETECRMAGRLLRVMLRQTHSSDMWQLPPEA